MTTNGPYALAYYLPEAARKAAAQQSYTSDRFTARGTSLRGLLPRCIYLGNRCCPVGVVFRAAGWDRYALSPNASTVAHRIMKHIPGADRDAVYADALDFIKSWDAGEIADLARAFDVTIGAIRGA